MRISKKEILYIPNILSYIRILLIPLFVYLYLRAETPIQCFYAALALGVSSISDLLDGKIARRFNMISELGIALDPIADKLTHIAVAICLCTRHVVFLVPVCILICKETYMGIMNLYKIKTKKKKLGGAEMFGKVSTAIVFSAMILLVLFPAMPLILVYLLTAVCSVSLIVSWIGYFFVFRKL
ncbi:MAG: CDP-alcohol phosphatidyltransferase family protein [Oscillospiraceae bacterium]|nr:CDP-alcohol phosphatidyltransferase family protein [Oscillospiraceae bacterium]